MVSPVKSFVSPAVDSRRGLMTMLPRLNGRSADPTATLKNSKVDPEVAADFVPTTATPGIVS